MYLQIFPNKKNNYKKLKAIQSPFLKEIEEKYLALLFWRFQKWMDLRDIYLCKIFYTKRNNTQMQKELFNNIFE